MKKYEKLENSDIQLKIQVYYQKSNERGYFASVSPVKVTNENGYTVEMYSAYSGLRKLILPVKRQSEKSYQLAVNISKEWIDILKQKVLSNIQG